MAGCSCDAVYSFGLNSPPRIDCHICVHACPKKKQQTITVSIIIVIVIIVNWKHNIIKTMRVQRCQRVQRVQRVQRARGGSEGSEGSDYLPRVALPEQN